LGRLIQRRQQERGEIDNNVAKRFGRCAEPLAEQECAPLAALLARKSIGEAGRYVGWQICLPSFKSSMDGFAENGSRKIERLRNPPKIVKVFHPRIGKAEANERFKFLSDDSLGWV
jgi:hypothetical protein